MNKEKPRTKIATAISLAREALLLVETRKRAMEPRLSEGLITSLTNDLSSLEAFQTGLPAKVIGIKGDTGSEAEISRLGAEWVRAVREAVKKRAPRTGLAKAVGVGQYLSYSRSIVVLSAIEAVLKAAEEYPDLIHACGILEADIQNGRDILDELSLARSEQELNIKSKKDQTTEKNITQLRVEAAIKEISTAGYIQYLESEPLIARRFKDLMPLTRSRKPKAVEETTETTGGVVLLALSTDNLEIKTEAAGDKPETVNAGAGENAALEKEAVDLPKAG